MKSESLQRVGSPAPVGLAIALMAAGALNAQEARIVRNLGSVEVICTDAIVVTHESNEILFDIVDLFHQELREQFTRLTRQAAGVRFGYSGRRDPTPYGLDSGFSRTARYPACDAHLEMKAEIAFRGRDLVTITSHVGIRRNELPSERSMPNSDRGVLDLWRQKIEIGPFEMTAVRKTAHEQALILANDFLNARQSAAQ